MNPERKPRVKPRFRPDGIAVVPVAEAAIGEIITVYPAGHKEKPFETRLERIRVKTYKRQVFDKRTKKSNVLKIQGTPSFIVKKEGRTISLGSGTAISRSHA